MKKLIYIILLLLPSVVLAQPSTSTPGGGTGGSGGTTYVFDPTQFGITTVTNITIKDGALVTNFVVLNLTMSAPFTLGGTIVTTTGTEFNYVGGVTSLIQNQLDLLTSNLGSLSTLVNAKQLTNSTLTRLAGIGVGTSGDVIYRDANGWTNLVKAADGTVLKLTAGLPAWGVDNNSIGGETAGTVHSGGDLTVDNTLVRSDGTGGTNVQKSVVLLSDIGALTAVESLAVTNGITSTTVELGGLGVTDTTLARSSAGNVSIEGNLIYRAGGTDVPVTDGGTGLSAGTSGGIPYFSSGTTIASSGALVANALVIGGGAGVTPATTTTGSGILTFIGTPSSANLATAITDETGSGLAVFATSPILTTPSLGVATATTVNKVTLTTPATGSTLTVADGKTLTVTRTVQLTSAGDSGVITLPNATATIPATSDKLSVFAATTSAELATVLSDEEGSGGGFVRATSPTLTTPNIGVATATTVNKVTVTAPATSATVTIADGKTFTVNQTTTLDRQSSTGLPVEFCVAASDETTAITTGTAKVTFRAPYAFTLTKLKASVNTAPTGSTILIDVNESGTTVISTKLMIDASEKTSETAATPYVISDSAIADDAELSIDFDQVGSSVSGTGVKVWIYGYR